MDSAKIDLFLGSMHDKFTPMHQFTIRERLANIPDERYSMLQALPYKDPIVMLIFSLFLGAWGVDRFLLGDTGLGILKLLTCGGFGVWVIIDWFLVMDRSRQKNFELFMQYA